MPILGASPLGLSFFSNRKDGNNFINEHGKLTADDAKKIGDALKEDRTRTVNVEIDPGTSTPTNTFRVDAGLNFLTLGDKKTIFTNNPKNPNTFHVFYNRDNDGRNYGDDGKSLIDYIQSSDKDYYNSNYLDENSSITKIIQRLGAAGKPEDAPTRSVGGIKLEYADFAYLKKLGVYPSNRMIVARRFGLGVGDDLVRYKDPPTAVVASWIEDAKEFISISFGENWEDVGNVNFGTEGAAIGEEYKLGGIGDLIKSGGNLFAAPGFTEYLQYYLFNQAGLTSEENLLLLPAGNPNIIRKAKKRNTYGGKSGTNAADQAFSGLSYDFSITIDTEYEIKYIDGIDPTLIYFDIISNLLRFGTSESQFQFDERFNKAAREKIEKFSSGDFTEVMDAVADLLKGMINAAKNTTSTLLDSLFGLGSPGDYKTEKAGTFNFTEAILSSQIKKYRLAFLGLIQALSGSPSGIYHVTVGNPLRPIFSSGDLLPHQNSGMKITLGPELGYNNLPTTIKFGCTLKNARPCGLQEIYKKFSPYPVRYSGNTTISTGTSEEMDTRTVKSETITRPRTPGSGIRNRNLGGLASRIFGR
jgi:hypothetical protein